MRAAMARSGREYQEPLRIGALPDRSSYRQVLAKQFAITSDVQAFERELKGAMRKVWDTERLVRARRLAVHAHGHHLGQPHPHACSSKPSATASTA